MPSQPDCPTSELPTRRVARACGCASLGVGFASCGLSWRSLRERRRTARDVSRRRRPHADGPAARGRRAAGAGRGAGADARASAGRLAGGRRSGWPMRASRALAIDLPGAVPAGRSGRRLPAWHQDIGAAVAFLASRPDGRAARRRSGLPAPRWAPTSRRWRRPPIRRFARSRSSRRRSTTGACASRTPCDQYGARPALLMASLQDPYAARSVRELAQDAAGPRELRWSTIPAHGTLLLQRDPDLVRSLVEWFQRTLG